MSARLIDILDSTAAIASVLAITFGYWWVAIGIFFVWLIWLWVRMQD